MRHKKSFVIFEWVFRITLILWVTCWAIWVLHWEILLGPCTAGETRLKVVWRGMKEEEMLKRLSSLGAEISAIYNKNLKALYLRDGITEDYYKDRQTLKSRPVTNKLYIFEVELSRGYYWVNEEGIVEEIAWEDITPI